MKIVSWNCNGALRRKLNAIDRLDADILIVQECEDPALSTEGYQRWAGRHVWTGDNKNRGIGIFPRRGQQLELLDWPDDGLKHFLPVRIDREFDLLGVWTKRNTVTGFSYIGQFWHYLRKNKANFSYQTIIAGDFNSNVIWDKRSRYWNHSDCVRELEAIGFQSLWHHVMKEPQGSESQPTLYLQRDEQKPYHIDYIFTRLINESNNEPSVSIGLKDDWLEFSDHMPIYAAI